MAYSAALRSRKARRAEEAAADWLTVRGFRIVGTNVRVGRLELDIVATRAGLLVIVEVRTRGDGAFESAFASVSTVKRRHLLNAAERLWTSRFVSDRSIERVRIDVASVTFSGDVTRVEMAEGVIVGG